MTILPVAVDAMGGDQAPGEIVAGVSQAVAAGIAVVLVGRAADLAGLEGVADLPHIEASEVIAMGEDPAQGVRRCYWLRTYCCRPGPARRRLRDRGLPQHAGLWLTAEIRSSVC